MPMILFAVRQQAINITNDELDVYRHVASVAMWSTFYICICVVEQLQKERN